MQSKSLFIFFVIVDVLLVILAVVAYITDDFRYVLMIFCCSPLILIQVCILVGALFRKLGSLLNFIMDSCISLFQSIGKRAREHHSKHKELHSMSSYDSIQDRAKLFQSIVIPDEMSDENDSFANKCIQNYATNGEISLTEEERARLSLVIMDTGISSQEPGEKNYYERERVAVLENILSEKIKA